MIKACVIISCVFYLPNWIMFISNIALVIKPMELSRRYSDGFFSTWYFHQIFNLGNCVSDTQSFATHPRVFESVYNKNSQSHEMYIIRISTSQLVHSKSLEGKKLIIKTLYFQYPSNIFFVEYFCAIFEIPKMFELSTKTTFFWNIEVRSTSYDDELHTLISQWADELSLCLCVQITCRKMVVVVLPWQK